MPARTSTLCNAGLLGLSPALIAPGRFPSSKVHLLRPHKSPLHVTNKNISRQTPRGENIKQIQIQRPAGGGSQGAEDEPAPETAPRNPRTWPRRRGRGRAVGRAGPGEEFSGRRVRDRERAEQNCGGRARTRTSGRRRETGVPNTRWPQIRASRKSSPNRRGRKEQREMGRGARTRGRKRKRWPSN